MLLFVNFRHFEKLLPLTTLTLISTIDSSDLQDRNRIVVRLGRSVRRSAQGQLAFAGSETHGIVVELRKYLLRSQRNHVSTAASCRFSLCL